ncbi:leucine-rich repeat-containing protein 10 [Hemiscyllium ocellatum]|uniref:leucine-rich repeat-containing protein 10 n=1 Tax=Hemiscyllium ocellatum TaxID=170820 RepID=UPI0029677AA3|nr:leucine-rich repeat-containing protein 10 [Hemiscyllium ocellatum]
MVLTVRSRPTRSAADTVQLSGNLWVSSNHFKKSQGNLSFPTLPSSGAGGAFCSLKEHAAGVGMGNALMSVVAFFPSKSCQKLVLGGDIEEMPPDKMLDLSGRHLRRFPVQACAFTQLLKLYLSNNNLSSLPAELQLLGRLQILALDFNRFRELPAAVCRLRQLSILYLGNNSLCDLPAELGALADLKTLWIECNCFERVPQVVAELRQLRVLHAGCNQLGELPRELRRLRQLQSIWLPGNQLGDFPPVLLEMESLEVIDLDRNKIRCFPSLAHMKNLKLVMYDHNPCKNAPRVAQEVRRVGRWADYRPEDHIKSPAEAAPEQVGESRDVEAAEKAGQNQEFA